MRRFVVIGRQATADGEFLLDDVPGTSGRLDILLRCVRAAMLLSHGLRREVTVYLVLLAGPRAPRIMKIDGATAKYLRPDERQLAILAKKVLRAPVPEGVTRFLEMRAGVSVAPGALDEVLADLGDAPLFMLDEGGTDIRDQEDLGAPRAAFFLGDHTGFSPDVREALLARGARRISVGPESVHADDAVAILTNELDRRAARTC